jgi:hypothetical protein
MKEHVLRFLQSKSSQKNVSNDEVQEVQFRAQSKNKRKSKIKVSESQVIRRFQKDESEITMTKSQ